MHGAGHHRWPPTIIDHVLPQLLNRLLREEFEESVAEQAGLVGGGAIAVRIKG